MMTFKIKTEVFEGPLDLLLDLVEKRKLLINDISLALVTDDYLSHLSHLETTDNSSRTDFILIASTLLLIKSRSLLPSLDLKEEEEHSIEELETRLKMLQIIREGGLVLGGIFGKKIIFNSDSSLPVVPVFSPHHSITLLALGQSIHQIISRLPKTEKIQKAIIKQVISLEEMIDRLTVRIQSSLSLSFKQFTHGSPQSKEQKVEVIVGFLAMLELVKQGIVDAIQENHFDDIKMETTSIGVPRY